MNHSPIALWLSRGASAERRRCGCTIFPIRWSACDPKNLGAFSPKSTAWPVLFARVFVTGGQLFFNEVVVMVLLAVGLTAYDPLVFLGVGGIVGAGALVIRMVNPPSIAAKQRRHSPPRSDLLLHRSKRRARFSRTHHVSCGAIGPTQAYLGRHPGTVPRCTAAKWCSASSPRGCMNCSPSPHCAASSSSACGPANPMRRFSKPFLCSD